MAGLNYTLFFALVVSLNISGCQSDTQPEDGQANSILVDCTSEITIPETQAKSFREQYAEYYAVVRRECLREFVVISATSEQSGTVLIYFNENFVGNGIDGLNKAIALAKGSDCRILLVGPLPNPDLKALAATKLAGEQVYEVDEGASDFDGIVPCFFDRTNEYFFLCVNQKWVHVRTEKNVFQHLNRLRGKNSILILVARRGTSGLPIYISPAEYSHITLACKNLFDTDPIIVDTYGLLD